MIRPDPGVRHELSGKPRSRLKDDGSPVTTADREIDHTLRALVRRERPDDAFLGEEFGARGRGPRRWILDVARQSG